MLVEARNISKRYGQGVSAAEVVRDISFDVEPGQFVAITGPSGAGKSTLLQILGGLLSPTSGEVRIAGKALSDHSDARLSEFRRRHVGFVFQSFNLLPTLTARENVLLPLWLDGRARADHRLRADELLEWVGLGHKRESYPDELSGGEAQRVAIARALIASPWLLLADEPTGNLDSANGEKILRLLQAICRERQQTVLLVSHDARLSLFADRVLSLVDGRLCDDITLHPQGNA